MNYEILISINLGDNFPLHEDFLSKECKTFAILEAKFNEEMLQSDPIEINSVNPELATELGFRLNKKDFHQFRTERKSIKLQCFVEYSTQMERHYVGYVILHLRDAQEYTNDPKYKWIVLLNPKYKGTSTKRPQLYMAFMVNKLNDDSMTNSMTTSTSSANIGLMNTSLSESQISNYDSLESHFTRPMAKKANSNTTVVPSSTYDNPKLNDQYDANLKVKYRNKYFYIWDENRFTENECNQTYLIKIQIDKPKNLINLFGKDSSFDEPISFSFRYNILGKQIRTDEFSDIHHYSDFKRHRFQLHIRTMDQATLMEYFDSYPTIEVQFCRNGKLVGFVTINILRLFDDNYVIDGDYMIVPDDESVYVKEPFPMINLIIGFKKLPDRPKQINTELETTTSLGNISSNHESSSSSSSLNNINHYYIAIDLRTIRLETLEDCQILFQPFYLQFSYAFFGITEPIKTYPAINFQMDSAQNAITIPHGFCGFNFSTTYEKLRYTFTNIPFMIQLILAKDDTLLGTAELDLSSLIHKQVEKLTGKNKNQILAEDLEDNFINTYVHVQDELNDRVCEIQVVMFLQEIQNTVPYCHDMAGLNRKLSATIEDGFSKNELIESLNDMIIETAHDIELWKEEQMKLFKDRLKQKENALGQTIIQSTEKRNKLIQMEERLRFDMEKLNEKERLLAEKTNEIDNRQKELDQRFDRLGHEIDDAIQDVRSQFEEKASVQRNLIKTLEQDKQKFQERIYQLEHRIKEKDIKIKEYETKLSEINQATTRRINQVSTNRATSLTRNVSTVPRKIVVTRDSSPLTKSMVEEKTGSNKNLSRPPTTKPRYNVPPAITTTTTTNTDTKSTLLPIDRIRKERQELIKKGISVKDPLIIEIDKRIRNHRLYNSKRI